MILNFVAQQSLGPAEVVLTAMPVVTPTRRAAGVASVLLDATVELVAERGFHAVGIAEIGAAAGVTGAAIYRHFANKQEMLVALFERVVDELLATGRASRGRGPTTKRCTAGTGRAARRVHVADRAIIAVYDQEVHNLPGSPGAGCGATNGSTPTSGSTLRWCSVLMGPGARDRRGARCVRALELGGRLPAPIVRRRPRCCWCRWRSRRSGSRIGPERRRVTWA